LLVSVLLTAAAAVTAVVWVARHAVLHEHDPERAAAARMESEREPETTSWHRPSAAGSAAAPAGAAARATRETGEAAASASANVQRTAEMRRALEALLDGGLGALWGEAPEAAAPTAVSSAAMPGPDPSAHNQANAPLGQYIANRIHDDFRPLATSCYQNALAQSPSLAGKVSLRFKIVGDKKIGAVVDTADVADGTDISDPSFLQCLKESMMTVNFDAPPDGTREVSSVFSMRFAPSNN
jgi:hypothetical protein